METRPPQKGEATREGNGMRTRRKVGIALLGVLACASVAVAVVMFGVFAGQLDKAFPAKVELGESTRESYDNGLAVARAIESDGAVLLKNDGVLPLSDARVNLLGYGAYNPVYGGSGSGGSSYTANRTDFVTALTEAGIEVNPATASVYQADGEEANTFSVDFSIPEVPATEELAAEQGVDFKYVGDASFEAMRDYSDTAVVVVSRKGGEGNDLPTSMAEYGTTESDRSKHYLELNDAELSLLARAEETFERVIVLINTGNAMELGFVEDGGVGDPAATGDVDAALWVGDPGDVGTRVVASILLGEVNPSGRTADIYPYAVETTPSFYNFDTYTYTNSAGCFEDFDSHPAYLLNYQEGIYVGYRYYETRGSYDYTTLEGDEVEGASYDDVVQYPFGYGLSYTTFDWEVTDATAEGAVDQGDTIKVTVKVTNTGDVAGKDVVELYYGAPYDALGSKIQKSSVVLGGFAKTGLIEPGASQSVTIELPVEQMASYDDGRYYSTTGSYVLERGDYAVSVRRNSHEEVAAYTYSIDDSVVFADEAASTGVEAGASYVGKRSSDKTAAVNRFDDVAGDVAYLSRDSWQIVPGSDAEATDEQLEAFSTALDLGDYESAGDEMPTTGAKTGLTLSDLKGKDYDDPQWEALLDQLTVDDLNAILATNGWGSAQIDSIGKPQTYDMDGPAAISYVFDAFMGTCTYETVSYPCEVVLASTWNVELASEFGDAISREAAAWNVSGWYAPGANLHRSAFGGRNFEYYSEDALLSGAMSSHVVGAATDNGLICYVKHFALNERETQRHYGLCTWADEQAIRELYLVPFEMSVQEGRSLGIMSAYNNFGTTWAGASSALLKDVLRGEWGFEGCVLTDNLEQHGFMDTEVAILNGGSSTLCNGMFAQDDVNVLAQSASGMRYLREAAHHYLYAEANSTATEGPALEAAWRMPARVGLGVVAVLSVAGIAALVVTGRKRTE